MVTGVTSSTMHIGQVAGLSGLSLHTLRHDDEIALLTPSGRSHGGFRPYTEADVARSTVIRRMKPLGFTLEQMREVVGIVEALADAHPDATDGVRQRLADYLQLARGRREQLQRRVEMADEPIDLLGRQ